ncbi:unnamed protein product [Rhodiola kirilowii]
MIEVEQIFDRSARDKNAKSLQDLILNEPELSRLGRVIRGQ